MAHDPATTTDTERPPHETAQATATGRSRPGNSRRDLLIGAGLAGVAGLAAACGGSDGGSDDGGSSDGESGDGGTGEGGSGTVLSASAAEIPVGGGKVFKDEKIVVCQPAQGQFTAFSAVCPHRKCTVGSVSGGTINCPCHGSKFKIADGSVVQPPARSPLEAKKATVEGGKVNVT